MLRSKLIGISAALVLSVTTLVGFSSHAYANEAAVESSAEKTTLAAAKKAEKRKKRVCKRTKITGSNIAKRVCMSQGKWDQLEAESKEATRDIQNRGLARLPENP